MPASWQCHSQGGSWVSRTPSDFSEHGFRWFQLWKTKLRLSRFWVLSIYIYGVPEENGIWPATLFEGCLRFYGNKQCLAVLVTRQMSRIGAGGTRLRFSVPPVSCVEASNCICHWSYNPRVYPFLCLVIWTPHLLCYACLSMEQTLYRSLHCHFGSTNMSSWI